MAQVFVKDPRCRLLIVALVAIILTATAPALAQVDPWEFEVYPYATLSRGTLEVETNNAVIANGHSSGGKRHLQKPGDVVQPI
jgi:hypothetical protein